MSKCYVFAIGGTGSRVLEQLTWLLAAGAAPSTLEGWELVPIVIDLDQSNGNLSSCIQRLQSYQVLHKTAGAHGNENQFFKVPVKSLREVAPEADEGFHLSVNTSNRNTLKETIDYNSLAVAQGLTATKDLVDLLYSNEDLDMNLSIGFQGKPHIGTLVLGQLAQLDARGALQERNFRAFVNNFQQGDRVFVISSIFGGTGAAGFPWLLKTLRSNAVGNLNQALQEAPIGAMVMMPYFTLQQESDSPINSQSFISKTKAALKFYHRNLREASAFYYMADDPSESNTGYENQPGGEAQRNPPHVAELFGGTGLFHFLDQDAASFPKPGTNMPPQLYRYGVGLEDGSTQITLNSFDRGKPTWEWLTRPLTRFYYAGILVRKALEQTANSPWALDTDLAKKSGWLLSVKIDYSFFSRAFFEELRSFMDGFTGWLVDYNRENPNCPVFTPFLPDPRVDGRDPLIDSKGADPMNGLILDLPPLNDGRGKLTKVRSEGDIVIYSVEGRPVKFMELVRRMNEVSVQVKSMTTDDEDRTRAVRLLEMLWLGTEKFISDYKIPL